MTGWEYKTLEFDDVPNKVYENGRGLTLRGTKEPYTDGLGRLNALGGEGWEAVSASVTEFDAGRAMVTMWKILLKRPLI